MTSNQQHESRAGLTDIAQQLPEISDRAVSIRLLLDGLERRLAGQMGILTPLVLIGWMAFKIPENGALVTLLVLQFLCQLTIAASSFWLRSAVNTGQVPRIRHMLWMFTEALSGAIWGAILILIGPLIGTSEAALTSWIAILVTMAVSILLAAPIAGIVFPLLGGFATALIAGLLLFDNGMGNFAQLALLCMTAALSIVAKTVNLQARSNCRAEIGVIALSERLEQELHRTSWLSRHDSLTGLLNRSALQEGIAAHGETRTPVILLDIDDFKAINDNYGHMQGDAVIAAVSACIKETLDAAAPDGLAARWGGEEFIIALPDSDATQTQAIAETLREAVAKLTHQDWPARLRVTGSLGIAHGPASAFSATFKSADSAMYEAKEQGRNRVICADASDSKVIKPARAA